MSFFEKLNKTNEKQRKTEAVHTGFFEKLRKTKGGYIFLSHSHDDIEKVRKIRNALEKDGFEPLCFYLKCLEDDDEIADLIKREIDAREWFVFVDSENARKSRWVTLEREYITRTNSKKIITVDVNDATAVSAVLEKITHNLRIFLSYSLRDRAVAKKLRSKLQEKDYLVYWDDDLAAGANWERSTANQIELASREGCVIVLLSENSMESDVVMNEILYAHHQGGNIIAVVLGDVTLPPHLDMLLRKRPFFRLSKNPTDEEMNRMIDYIGRSILK